MFLRLKKAKPNESQKSTAITAITEPIVLKEFAPADQNKAKEIRIDALAECNDIPIPANFMDPVSFKPLVHPMITPYGRIYSYETLEIYLKRVATDPLTSEPLTLGQVHRAPDNIIAILEEFNQFRLSTMNTILKASDPEVAAKAVNFYRLKLIQLDDKMGTACKQLVTQAAIKKIKDNLKIDVTNPAHKKFWESKGKINHQIPTHVGNMMSAANDSYDTVEDFLEAVNAERHGSCCLKFFKATFRDSVTRKLYGESDDKIMNFVVR